MKTLCPQWQRRPTGREGRVKSDDETVDMDLSVPRELGGLGGGRRNPEQLFAADSACVGGALGCSAWWRASGKIDAKPTVTANVSIGKTDGGGFGLAVELEGTFPGVGKEQARALMQAAHQVCPYSAATRNNVDVKLSVA